MRGSRPAAVIPVLLGLAGCFLSCLMCFFLCFVATGAIVLSCRETGVPVGRAELCLIHSFAIGLQSPLIEPGSRSGVQLPPRRETLLSEW